MRGGRRKPTELDLRRTPMQARGQATFERILDATAQLLDKVGTDALTTNLIAKAADVNVATLYQYFPNKQAVLLSLFQRQNEARIELGERMLERHDARIGLAQGAARRRASGGAVTRGSTRRRRVAPGDAIVARSARARPAPVGVRRNGARQ